MHYLIHLLNPYQNLHVLKDVTKDQRENVWCTPTLSTIVVVQVVIIKMETQWRRGKKARTSICSIHTIDCSVIDQSQAYFLARVYPFKVELMRSILTLGP
jgi:hypothetical protein